MKRVPSVIRTLLLLTGSIAGHTVRIAHSLVGLAGAAMLSWGVAMIYVPAGWISGGVFLCAMAYELAGAAGARVQRDAAPTRQDS